MFLRNSKGGKRREQLRVGDEESELGDNWAFIDLGTDRFAVSIAHGYYPYMRNLNTESN
jgi:hypothetical protein